MKIAYSGHRYIHDYDLDVIGARVRQDTLDPDVEEMIFGGAIGFDSHALRFAYLARGASRRGPKLTVVCPDTLDALPALAKAWTRKYADQYYELKNPIHRDDGWLSFELRNRFMVDMIRGQGQLEAFWSGRKPSGTWNAIQYAVATSADWVHILIRGAGR